MSCSHVFPANFDLFFSEIQECLQRDQEQGSALGAPASGGGFGRKRGHHVQGGLFEDVRVRRYLWSAEYTADRYIDLLNTYSSHHTMEPPLPARYSL